MNNTQKLDLILLKISGIDDRLCKLEKDVLDIKTDIKDLKIKVEDLTIKVEDLTIKVSDLTIKVSDLTGYRERNNKSIEIETSKSYIKELQETNQSLIYINLEGLFPKTIEDFSGNKIIEFDGLILGTNDRVFASKYNSRYKNREDVLFNISPEKNKKYIYKLFIIEAKHKINKEKILDKYKKFKNFKFFLSKIREGYSYITDIEGYNTNKFEKFKMKIEKMNLTLFEPENIFLVFGTPVWNAGSSNELEKIMKKDSSIKKIELSGNRYKSV